MNKRVALNFEGNLDQQGFQVQLEIGEEGQLPLKHTEKLLAAPELVQSLQQWQQNYRNLSHMTRITLHRVALQTGTVGLTEQITACRQATNQLEQQFKAWLATPAFTRLDLRLRESLDRQDRIRVIICSADRRLHTLPWHLWELIERYPQAEIALGTAITESIRPMAQAHAQVNVLAILGDSRGINIAADRQVLENCPGAKVTFLHEPRLSDISQQLWQQSWQILFFAGHSQTEAETGRIYLNAEESLTIEELRLGLKRSIQQGLQLAIFNSCDGLGLAYALESLNLPQMIVMREPVPDRLAQMFLKYFLTAYAQGESLYLAVRTARERLQEELEREFPCAGWLPVICQNAMAVPPTWQELTAARSDLKARQTIQAPPALPHRWYAGLTSRLPCQISWRKFVAGALISLGVTAGLTMLRITTNSLQESELKAFDQMLRLRAQEELDPDIVIIEVTAEDIAAQKRQNELMQRLSTSFQTRNQRFDVSLSDRWLNQLLQKLQAYRPSVIGLDIYRDFPVEAASAELSARLNHSALIVVCKQGDADDSSISSIDPPPEVPLDRVGFSDFQADPDTILRRHLLRMSPTFAVKNSRCHTDAAFSTRIAAAYLKQRRITLAWQSDDHLKLNNQLFYSLRSHSGGYHGLAVADSRVSQILINYRAPGEVAERITLHEFLQNPINASALQGKIVLIGVSGTNDYWATPYGEMPGVVVQAHLISQLIRAAIDRRPLLQVWSSTGEFAWILTWAVLGSLPTFSDNRSQKLRKFLIFRFSITILILISSLFGICFIMLNLGLWVPFVPSGIAIGLSGSILQGYLYSVGKRFSSQSISDEV